MLRVILTAGPEVSLLGYEDQERRQIIPYTDDLYAKVGRNIARALWDYYKIVATIPLEESSDEESGIPKPGPAKSAAHFRSFNMDRLKEVERQRQQTAQSFDETQEKVKKISDAKSGPPSRAYAKQRDFVRMNSGKFKKSLSISSETDSLDNLSNLTITGGSSGENDYTEGTGGGAGPDKVLTPIVSLELDEVGHSRLLASLARSPASTNPPVYPPAARDRGDDVDFFFSPGGRGGRAGARQAGLPPPPPLGSLQISRLGGLEEPGLLPSLPTPGRKIGGGGQVSLPSAAPLPHTLAPFLPESPTIARPSKHSSLPGIQGSKRRKKGTAGHRISKDEYFSKLNM